MSGVRKINWSKPAAGARGDFRNKKPRVAIAFDEDTFRLLQALAADRKVSFGEAVRHSVALGLRRQTIPAEPTP